MRLNFAKQLQMATSFAVDSDDEDECVHAGQSMTRFILTLGLL